MPPSPWPTRLLVSGLLYRRLGWTVLLETLTGAARTTGLILFVIGSAASFGWLLAYLEVPAAAVEALRAIADDRTTILLMMNVMLLLLGTFMDLAPLIIICTPIFLPVAKSFGVDPVHFGIVLLLNAGIGLITPPVGSVLFVGAAIGAHQRDRGPADHLAVLCRGPVRAGRGHLPAGLVVVAAGVAAIVAVPARVLAGLARGKGRGQGVSEAPV